MAFYYIIFRQQGGKQSIDLNPINTVGRSF